MHFCSSGDLVIVEALPFCSVTSHSRDSRQRIKEAHFLFCVKKAVIMLLFWLFFLNFL